MTISRSVCDQCGEIVNDIDAGFSPGRHQMSHDCGGTWRREIRYRSVDGVTGYAEGDVLVSDTGERSLVVRDGRGLALVRA